MEDSPLRVLSPLEFALSLGNEGVADSQPHRSIAAMVSIPDSIGALIDEGLLGEETPSLLIQWLTDSLTYIGPNDTERFSRCRNFIENTLAIVPLFVPFSSSLESENRRYLVPESQLSDFVTRLFSNLFDVFSVLAQTDTDSTDDRFSDYKKWKARCIENDIEPLCLHLFSQTDGAFYQKYILPKLIDFAFNSSKIGCSEEVSNILHAAARLHPQLTLEAVTKEIRNKLEKKPTFSSSPLFLPKNQNEKEEEEEGG
eukprot:CAMPEP_0201498532 /NCGR_PEP_ID=MMETSP0151_2-20130828/71641_1 /ASSEMBLY_ACC=CAM_ASM_000257 /TAXON_ID=200890 /ORGANISM="Paramoeba atlantica, Strain 621/1 / CCAP 1560/9" /LENGTH=255 /DNA_ID=CAMNT_0047890179 /DNA_START=1 /DNA_END=764 /DNA_ORIENTATION=-